MLVVEQISAIRNGRPIFVNIRLRLHAGEALMVRGKNGAGKSTLLRTIAGLRRPDAGSVSWRGGMIDDDRDAYCAVIGYLGHQNALHDRLTALENFLAPPLGAGGHGAPERSAAQTALEAAGLAAVAEAPTHYLSTGQRRRLALARLAAAGKTLWLLDEPLSGLDGDSVEWVERLIAGHRAKGGMVIVTSHTGLVMPGASELAL